jgi:transcriptional antiterminator
MGMPLSLPSNPMRDPNSLIEMLMKAFNEEVFLANFTITDQCRKHVRDMVVKGAHELVRIHAQNYQVKDAEQNIRRFAREMITDAVAHGETELRETNFFSVMNWICPFFPFC